MDPDIVSFMGVMGTIVVTGGLGYAMIVLVNAYARRLGPGGATSSLESRVDALARRLEAVELDAEPADADRLEARLIEVEERLDFTERMLAQRERAAQLKGTADEP